MSTQAHHIIVKGGLLEGGRRAMRRVITTTRLREGEDVRGIGGRRM